MKAPTEKSVVAWITIKLHDNEGLSVEGHIGDPKFVTWLLDNAKDAVCGRATQKDLIIVPNRDVDVKDRNPPGAKPLGDMKPEDRGEFNPNFRGTEVT